MTVRALLRAVRVPGTSAPYDTLHVRIYYPGRLTGAEAETIHGVVALDPVAAPYPVVILLGGMSCAPEGYRWLAAGLAEAGYVTLLPGFVAETLPGVVSYTPGFDMSRVRPDTYGTGLTCPILQPLRALLEVEQEKGPLAGGLDLSRIVLAGHSAGGTAALHNVRPDLLPGVVAGFTYAGHTVPSRFLGFPEGAVLPVCNQVPLLLMVGSEDGVIAASSSRYGDSVAPDPILPVRRTFEEALEGDRGDRYLAIIDGANHFTFLDPADPALGRGFLDRPEGQSGEALRTTLLTLIVAFLARHVRAPASVSGTRESAYNTNHASNQSSPHAPGALHGLLTDFVQADPALSSSLLPLERR